MKLAAVIERVTAECAPFCDEVTLVVRQTIAALGLAVAANGDVYNPAQLEPVSIETRRPYRPGDYAANQRRRRR